MFRKELIYFLKKLTLGLEVVYRVLGFDFSVTSRLAFVYTVGRNSDSLEAKRTGLLGLSRVVRNLSL